MKTRKELLEKIHDELLERNLRNEIDVRFLKVEDKFVNTPEAKRTAREGRDRALYNVGATKRTLVIIDNLLSKEE